MSQTRVRAAAPSTTEPSPQDITLWCDIRGNHSIGRIVVHKGGAKLIELLLKHGGDVFASNDDGFGLKAPQPRSAKVSNSFS